MHDFNVWLQFIFNPALFCGQCMSNPENTFTLSPFLCLNNWYNVQIASLRIFLKNFTLKEQKLTKYFFYEKMRHWWIKTTNFQTHPLVHHPLNGLFYLQKSWKIFAQLLFSCLTLSKVIVFEIMASFIRISSCLLWS